MAVHGEPVSRVRDGLCLEEGRYCPGDETLGMDGNVNEDLVHFFVQGEALQRIGIAFNR